MARGSKKKYDYLKHVANINFEDSWQLLQFCLSVKCVQNIFDNNLPFIGFILYKPSSLKSTIIDSFQKYPLAIAKDDLTKNSFLSHYSTHSEEDLEKNDLIPQMKDKILLTSEITPIINANEDDLRKILGIITRLIDGKGYQSHSGTHGHRGYPPMMFTWVGAGIEIPPKMWILLSQLGFKLYFFRPVSKKKTINDLKEIAKDNHLLEKKQQLENALLDYLKIFDATPETNEIILNESSNPKIKWDQRKDDESVLDFISNLANLLAALSGTVFTSFSKTKKSTKLNKNDRKNENNDNDKDDTEFIQTEQIDYEIEPSITEDASRAVIQLRNLALANAISQGRNYLTKEDAKLIINVCFSTTKIYRARLIDLLLKNNGELTTSQIAEGLQISKPHAIQTMLEFDALKIGKVSTISSYERSERKIKLIDEYKWFLTDEFKQLYRPTTELTPDLILQTTCCKMNSQYVQIITKHVLNNQYLGTCDTENKNCHTSKVNSNHGSNKKNNFINYTENNDENSEDYDNNENTSSITNTKENLHNNNTIISLNDKNTDDLNLKEKNTSLQVKNLFTRVTPSHEKCHKEKEIETKQTIPEGVVEDILKIIKADGGQIALNYALQLAIQKRETVKGFLENEKLTARESRKVRNIFC